MKQLTKMMAIIALSILVFTACEEKISMPEIINVELGSANSKKVVAGNDLHIEAEIVAQNKIAQIRLVIHMEEEHHHSPAMKISSSLRIADEWEVDTIYTGAYANVKNTDFHEHIEVPADAHPGTYHVHLYVTDMEGNQAKYEDEIEVVVE